jgi:hypothetical protein
VSLFIYSSFTVRSHLFEFALALAQTAADSLTGKIEALEHRQPSFHDATNTDIYDDADDVLYTVTSEIVTMMILLLRLNFLYHLFLVLMMLRLILIGR